MISLSACSAPEAILPPSFDADTLTSIDLFSRLAPAVSAEFLAIPALLRIYRRHETLVNELKSVRTKLNRAQAYLQSPRRNQAFALANVDHFRAKHSAALTELRANRRSAHQVLAALENTTI